MHMQYKKNGIMKMFIDHMRGTPFHPQWLLFNNNKKNFSEIAGFINGIILDIGCSDKQIKKYLSAGFQYIGLDYYKTAMEWYGSKPETFGDAQNLPFADNCIDSVLLLDVLEHLPDPERCLDEVNRVLVGRGVFIILVPFLYPIHDAPLDFHRWTIFGLRKLVQRHGFKIVEEKHEGNPAELAGLMMSIALSKTVLNWFHQKNPAAISVILLPFIIFIINISTSILAYMSPQDGIMPWGYRLVLEKYK